MYIVETNIAMDRFGPAFDQVCGLMIREGQKVDTGHWQAMSDVPHTKTVELRDVVLKADIPPTLARTAQWVEPNLPWAEDHFQERVSGKPLNPGEEYKNWPWYKSGVEEHKPDGQFSHTYMERFWPKEAGAPPMDPFIEGRYKQGIRYPYGDLNDVVNLLWQHPYTRQAYLPVWFPEDTGAVHGERVPCTLGYHFMMRQDRLHVFYPMRSCDLLRYLRDDMYLAMRLGHWVLHELWALEENKLEEHVDEATDWLWADVKPGSLTMHISSLHVFEGDIPSMIRKQELGHHA